MLVPGVVVDVDGDASERAHFGGEGGETGVVLSVLGGGLDGDGWGGREGLILGWGGEGRTARGRRLRTWWVVFWGWLGLWRIGRWCLW